MIGTTQTYAFGLILFSKLYSLRKFKLKKIIDVSK